MSGLRILLALVLLLALGLGAWLFLEAERDAQPARLVRETAARTAAADGEQAPPDAPAGDAPTGERVQREPILVEDPATPGAPLRPRPSGQPESRREAPGAFVRGRLRSESGSWRDLPLLLQGGVLVDLVSATRARTKRQAVLGLEDESDGAVAITFAFEELEPGPYSLTVSSLESEVWIPATLQVEAPSEGIEILCRNRARRVQLEFSVLDDATGEPVEGWSATSIRQTVSEQDGVLMHAGPLALEGFAVDGRLEWSLWAPGHAPAFGDQNSFVPRSDDVWGCEVRLRRGWGARVLALARDPSMRPAAGALVTLDSRQVGATGAAGWIDVWSEAPPAVLSVVAGDRRGRLESPPGCEEAGARTRGHVLVVLLE